VGSTEIAQVLAFSGLQFVDAGEGRAGDRLVACGLRTEFAKGDGFTVELIAQYRFVGEERPPRRCASQPGAPPLPP
jgi:hypothetical protein